jgi:hypothetical protein
MVTDMKPKLLLCLALGLGGMLSGCSSASAQAGLVTGASLLSTDARQTKAIASEADLDRVVSRLQIPAQRFDAMLTLLEFAGWPKGNNNNPDPKVNALHDRARTAVDNCPGLDAVVDTMIAGLKDPKTRLPMIETLLGLSGGFGGMQGYSPSTPLQKLMARASRAAYEAFDVPTVAKALADADELLRVTAVRQFGTPHELTNRLELSAAEIQEWKPLLPQMEALAAGDDESIRYAAAESLRRFPGTEQFLAGRESSETSANVLMRLVADRYYGEAYQQHFLARFVPLLSNPDEKARVAALGFVAFNQNSAPMYHIPFGLDVFDRVIASTKSGSANERGMAVAALAAIRQLNPDRSRIALLKLVNDPDENVRWRIPAGLADQLNRPDVKQALAMLVQDQSPLVSYFAILAAGPAHYIPELEAMAKGPDARMADWAAQKLKQIGE